jgi:UDP-N-acetylmuramoyl-tripeptide--D-alanyl-D-alanine ligase
MEPRALKFVTAACAGEQLGGSEELLVRRVCTDSRLAQAGDLFIALAGDRFDGHDFLEDVSRKGVQAVVVQRDRTKSLSLECPVIAVEDTRRSLGFLAARYRADFSIPLIAVGGSNGKTTVKELVASVLRQKLQTLWSEGSFNNDIGVPMSLLRLERAHQAAVFEVGTNHPGELAPLVKLIQPQHGVITSVGREHMEFFGDLAAVAEEEGTLAELLPADGKLFINGDDEWAAAIARRSRATVVRAGFGDRNHWRAHGLVVDKGGTTFGVNGLMRDFAGEYRVNLLGRHQVVNALFAIALGAELGLTMAEIQLGLAACKPAKMRLQFWETNGVGVLDDAYNANADSAIAALQTLKELPCKGRRIAVLGDMAELGNQSDAAHEEVGRRAAELGIGQLFAVGKMAARLAHGAREAGLNRIIEIADVETAAAAIKSFMKTGDVVLLKASRVARFERISDFLRSGETQRKN